MSFPLEYLVRPNIRALEPYSCARDEYEGDQALFLDANENPFDTGLNRYPDPHQRALKKALSALKGVPVERMVQRQRRDHRHHHPEPLPAGAGQHRGFLPGVFHVRGGGAHQ